MVHARGGGVQYAQNYMAQKCIWKCGIKINDLKNRRTSEFAPTKGVGEGEGGSQKLKKKI